MSSPKPKMFFKQKTTFVSIRFVVYVFLLLFFSGIIFTIIYAWNIETALERNELYVQPVLLEDTATKITNVLQQDYTLLVEDFNTNKTLDPSLSKYFDVGIIQSKNIRSNFLNFNNTKFQAMLAYAKQITPNTSQFFVDATNNMIYVTYVNPDNSYEIGGFELSGSTVNDIINISNYHVFLVSNQGNIVLTNTQNANMAFISSLHLNYASFAQIKIGNMHRAIFTYTPIENLHIGLAILSLPLPPTTLSYIQSLLPYLTLLEIALFLALIVVFSILVDAPLTYILKFFENFNKDAPGEIEIKRLDSFGVLASHINMLLKDVKKDFKRISKADALQDDFIHLSAHMLRTPLTSLQGYLDILKSSNHDTNLNTIIGNLEMSLNKLTNVEENIIALSEETNKILNSTAVPTSAAEIMEQAYNSHVNAALQKNLNLIIDTSYLLHASVKVNKDQIIHALKNLLDNAIKFTAEGGTVKLYGKTKDNNVIISVSDTGIGMTKEELESLFQKFSKVSDTMEYNADGLGIGLYVVKTIVEACNGQVTVDSIKGSGSIFNIILPLS